MENFLPSFRAVVISQGGVSMYSSTNHPRHPELAAAVLAVAPAVSENAVYQSPAEYRRVVAILSYADSVNRRAWIVFVALQFIGIICGMSAESIDRWGAQFLVVSFIGLLPGNVLAALLVERSFWNTAMTLRQMSLLEIPVMVLINGVIWLFCAVAFRTAKRASAKATER